MKKLGIVVILLLAVAAAIAVVFLLGREYNFTCPDLQSPAYNAEENVYWINCIPPIGIEDALGECRNFEAYQNWVKRSCSFDGTIKMAQ